MRIGRIQLKNRVLVASSPLTSKVCLLHKADLAGASGASTKLTFIKQPFYGRLAMYTEAPLGGIICHDRRLDLEEGVQLVREAKCSTDLAILANITHEAGDLNGWAYLARQMEAAGADAIELNLTCPNITLGTALAGQQPRAVMGASIGESTELTREVTHAVKGAVAVPVIPKFSGRVDVVPIALACQEGGADAISVSAGGRSALPSLDVHHPERSGYGLVVGNSYGALVGPARRLAGYADVARAASAVDIPIIASGGVSTWRHAVEYMMWGASAVQICTAVMWHGFDVISDVLRGMKSFLREAGHSSYDEIVGRALGTIRPAHELEIVQGAAQVDSERCSGCGSCLKPGHCLAITMDKRAAHVDATQCLGCGICVALCPRQAIKLLEKVGEGH